MVYLRPFRGVDARQKITYTDFPMQGITLYACWGCEHWVIMLPSEYWLHEKVKVDDHLHAAQSVRSTDLTARTVINSLAVNASHLGA